MTTDAHGPQDAHEAPGAPGSPEPYDAREAHRSFLGLLHAQRVWDVELPSFDPAAAPPDPLALFHRFGEPAV
ncbi:hypothetical protein ACWC5G_31230, partial [Streptomyces sp. NPDC001274]